MNNPNKSRRMARPPYVADAESAASADGAAADTAGAARPDKAPTKQSVVIAMLRADVGTSLAEMVEATGWQAHTVRAALTGLRKKHHAIERFAVDGETRYRIAPVATA